VNPRRQLRSRQGIGDFEDSKFIDDGIQYMATEQLECRQRAGLSRDVVDR
jgi:hypothetical protein